jgi:hypothetical protein
VILSARSLWVLTAAVLLACAAFDIYLLPPTIESMLGDTSRLSDFNAIWSWSRFAHTHPVAAIYDDDALHSFQVATDPAITLKLGFPYPPTYLFAIWPLASLPFGIAYAAWGLATLAFFAWAVCGTRPKPLELLLVVLAPITAVTLSYGQNGLLISGLIVGGLRLVPTRPVIGGILLGLATIKPQLGVLVPLALLASERWTVLVSASVTAVMLALAAGLAFGWDIWPAWIGNAAGHAGYLEHDVGNYIKPSIMANLELFGTGATVAYAIQSGLTIAAAAAVYWIFRRGYNDLSVAALQVGTFLAMPFVFRYDMQMLVNAILLLVRGRTRRMGLAEAGIIALGVLFPAVITLTTRFFYASGLTLILLFGLVLWRVRGVSPEDTHPRRSPGGTRPFLEPFIS